MNELKNTIIQKIKEGEIKQTSRWYFVSKDWLFYLLTAITTIVGALAVSSILHQTVTEHIRPLAGAPRDFEYVLVFLKSAPYIWLVVLAAFIAAAWFNFKNTSRSYRHHNALIVAGVVIVSLLGGGVLFATGHGKKFDDSVRKAAPFYQKEIDRRAELRKGFMDRRGAKLRAPKRASVNDKRESERN